MIKQIRNMKNLSCFLFMLTLVALVAGCGGGSGSGSGGSNSLVPNTSPSISISPANKTIAAGERVTLTVTAANTGITWPAKTGATANYTQSGNTAIWTPPATAGEYEFTVSATADAFRKATARVRVEYSKVATLGNLEIMAGDMDLSDSLNPAFDPAITGYTLNVGNNVKTLAITGTGSHAKATVDVAAPAELMVGRNAVTVTVTAEDGATTKVYYVTVIRAASGDATLKAIAVSSGNTNLIGSLQPAFSPTTYSYRLDVANSVTAINISGTANHAEARVEGGVFNLHLNTGSTVFRLTVTAADGATKNTYSITVIRATLSNDTTLGSISIVDSVGRNYRNSLVPALAAGVYAYTLEVANSVTSISVSGTAGYEGARVEGAVTNFGLNVGDNVITLTVVAADGMTRQNYTITIVRTGSRDATLRSLMVSSAGKDLTGSLTPAFSPGTYNYTLSVAKTVTAITIDGEANDASAQVLGNVAGWLLNEGDNVFTLVVTAADGVTTQSYTITVKRAATVAVSKVVKLEELTPSATGGSSFSNLGDVSLPDGTYIFDCLGFTFYTDGDGFRDYTLDGKYTHIAGDLFANTSSLSDWVRVSLWGDNVLLTEAFFVRGGGAPVHFEASLIGVKILKVSIEDYLDSTSSASVGIGNVKLTTVGADASVANLSSITISNEGIDLSGAIEPVFDSAISAYWLAVENDITSITVNGIASNATAQVTGGVTGQTLQVGSNVIPLTVTAENGVSKDYTVTVVRATAGAGATQDVDFLTLSPSTYQGSAFSNLGDVSLADGTYIFDCLGFTFYTDGDGFRDYAFDGKYARIEGDLFANTSSSYDWIRVSLWGDDKLLTSVTVVGGNAPAHFEASLAGVKVLKVSIEDYLNSTSSASVGIGNVKLSKWR